VSGRKYRRARRAPEYEKAKPVALVIENDDALNESICDALSEAGLDCVQAFSTQEGLEFIKTEDKPSLIVVNGELQDVNGFQCCAYLKLNPATNLIPQIMLVRKPPERAKIDGLRIEPDRYCLISEVGDKLSATAKDIIDAFAGERRSGVNYSTTITLQSNLKFLDKIEIVLNKALQSAGFDEVDEQKIKYVTLEMGHNAMEWGNKNVAENKVQMIVRVDDQSFHATIKDEGEGFDYDNIPHAAQPEDPVAHMEIRETMGLREGGFGIMLAREFMDEVSYNDKGNEVTLIKYKNRNPVPSEATG